MATVKLPKTYLADTFLIVDDEPEHIEWLYNFILGKSIKIDIAHNVEEAINLASEYQYRAYIVDLNIPMGNWTPNLFGVNDVYEKYKGFYVLKYIRSQGNLGRNVSAYSSHHNQQIIAETKQLYCGYSSKDKVQEFKREILNIISTPIGPHEILKSTMG
ncbi:MULTISPECIES: response regulator [Burkholderia]|uniref:response regulator n=1 Tax=Burkholderia TaxID=32008 RepID=UPI001178C8CD|nr:MULTISPECIES: response regulator [Burkholderia]MBY4727393.1 response regulator [Burkholderia contaminans]MCI3973115.1 response regulator [Burkholderia sp. HI4860]